MNNYSTQLYCRSCVTALPSKLHSVIALYSYLPLPSFPSQLEGSVPVKCLRDSDCQLPHIKKNVLHLDIILLYPILGLYSSKTLIFFDPESHVTGKLIPKSKIPNVLPSFCHASKVSLFSTVSRHTFPSPYLFSRIVDFKLIISLFFHIPNTIPSPITRVLCWLSFLLQSGGH